MTAYFLIFALLWSMYLAGVIEGRRLLVAECAALILFVVFGGFRFETGNDWIIYRDAYLELPELFRDDISRTDWFSFEPFYVALTLLLKGFVDFQWAMALIVLLNAAVLYWLCQRLHVAFVGVFAVYYAWVYLGAQMAAIRYSISASLVLLSVYAALRHRRGWAMALAVVASGFHVSALLFLPLLFLVTREPRHRDAIALIFVASLGAFSLITSSQVGLLSWLPFYEKIGLYVRSSEGAVISWGALAYIGINMSILYVSARGVPTPVSLLAFWGTAYLLIFQIGLWFMPVFWNRVMAVVIVFQACFLYERLARTPSYGLFVMAMAVSGLVLFKQLGDPAAISYIPYQNYVLEQVFRYGKGDGDERFYEALEIHQERNVR